MEIFTIFRKTALSRYGDFSETATSVTGIFPRKGCGKVGIRRLRHKKDGTF